MTKNNAMEKADEFFPLEDCAKFITKSIGSYINLARCKYNLSIRKFSKDINVSSTVISDLENGTKIPRMETIIKILCSLNIPLEYIFAERVLPPKVFKTADEQYLYLHRYLTKEGLSKEDIKEVLKFIEFKKYLINRRNREKVNAKQKNPEKS